MNIYIDNNKKVIKSYKADDPIVMWYGNEEVIPILNFLTLCRSLVEIKKTGIIVFDNNY